MSCPNVLASMGLVKNAAGKLYIEGFWSMLGCQRMVHLCTKISSQCTIAEMRGVVCLESETDSLCWCHLNLDCILRLTGHLSMCLYRLVEIASIFFCILLFWWSIAVQVHMLRSPITDVTSKFVLLSLTSELRPNCPATVLTPPVVANYNMKWSIVIPWMYYRLPTGG